MLKLSEGKRDKVQLILEAAVAVFSQKGYEAARIEDIAQQAAIGKGTVYEYFESKKQLFEEMLKYSLSSYASVFMAALESSNSLTSALERLVLVSLQFIDDHRPLARVLMDHPTGGPSPALRRWILEWRYRLIRAVRQVVEQHLSRDCGYDADIAAHIIIGAVDSLTFTRLLAASEDSEFCDVTPDQLAGRAARLLVNGLMRS